MKNSNSKASTLVEGHRGRWSLLTRRSPVALALASVLVVSACANAGSAESKDTPATKAPTVSATHPEEISFGETVELTKHLVQGDITVFDFTSPYCPPCRQIAPWLERLHKERPGVSVVKVNINRPKKRGIDWASPVARQFGLQSIPAFLVYDADGKILAEGDAAKRMVIGWLQQLEDPGEDS